ncbi:MAG: RluA family pseudouridine synthase [candidate division Zixibacteria bacterium]|nr:RluA family pseudouridine synthase [candidate division Zixibacteria bacterium]
MDAPILRLEVSEEETGNRLDVFCTHRVEGHTRSHFTKLATAGYITSNGRVLKASYKVKSGDRITLEMVAPPPIDAQPEEIPLDIVHEDDYLLVVNKPSGMVCHPAAGNYSGTLINGLLFYFSQLKNFSDRIRPGLVHRLDKDTSGLLVIAKDEKILAQLQAMMKQRLISREYIALVWGKIAQAEGTIDLPIGRSPSDRKVMKVNGVKPRDAVTHYRVIKSFEIAELVGVKLQTGRTHQIRVHLSYFGTPVVGDSTYGGRSRSITRLTGPKKQIGLSLLKTLDSQALHAQKLSFEHPATGEQMSFQSDLPEDFQKAVEILEAYS